MPAAVGLGERRVERVGIVRVEDDRVHARARSGRGCPQLAGRVGVAVVDDQVLGDLPPDASAWPWRCRPAPRGSRCRRRHRSSSRSCTCRRPAGAALAGSLAGAGGSLAGAAGGAAVGAPPTGPQWHAAARACADDDRDRSHRDQPSDLVRSMHALVLLLVGDRCPSTGRRSGSGPRCRVAGSARHPPPRSVDRTGDPPRVLSIGLVEQSRDRSAPTTAARVMTGGIAPRSTSSSATRTLIELTIATRRDGRPRADRRVQALDRDSASACGRAQVDHEVGLVEQPRAGGRAPARRTSTARPTSRR